ncbi:MAG: glycosyltransferase [Pseudomonadota bacterium]|nr:glycosyltransferase [Pseudomonadota bacterium]
MKISIIGPVFPYRGGIAHFTTLLAKNMIQEGHDVQMISFKKQYPKWLYPGESDKDFSETREKIEADFIITPFNPFSWRKAIGRIKEFNPEKVIFPWWVTFWGPCFQFIARAMKRNGTSVTFLVHNTLPHEVSFIDRFITKNTLKFANHFIVMTDKEKQKLLRLLPEANEIKIAPHPIYNMFKPTGMDKNTILAKLNLPQDKKFVLFFGFVRPYKGLPDLLDAMELCNKENPQIHLIVAGEFWGDKDRYLQQIQSLGIQDNTHIFDHYIPDDDVAMYFEVSDLFVAPYTGGTQSGAVKTALGFGLPSVVSNMINDKIIKLFSTNCIITPSNDPKKLAMNLIQALKLPRQDPSHISMLFNQTWGNFVEKIVDSAEKRPTN